MEIDKHSLNIGDYNRTVGKGPGSRPQISKESSMERNPYFDKVQSFLLFFLFFLDLSIINHTLNSIILRENVYNIKSIIK